MESEINWKLLNIWFPFTPLVVRGIRSSGCSLGHPEVLIKLRFQRHLKISSPINSPISLVYNTNVPLVRV